MAESSPSHSAAEAIGAPHDSDQWRMLQPVEYGGRGLDAGEFVSVVSAIAALDGSLGWLGAMFNVAAYDVAGLPNGAADDVWGADPTSLVAASYQPAGRLVPSGHDGRLSGRWRFVAGGRRANWLLLMALQDAARCRVLIAREDATIEPVHDQIGLPAADLCDVTVSELLVVQPRIFQSACGREEFSPEHLLLAPVVIGAGAAAAVVGSADGVWRLHVDQVRERLAASYGGEDVTDRTASTVQVARAASDIDAAQLQVAGSVRSDADGADVLHAAAWAHRQAVVRARDAADVLLSSNRRHALDASDPVTRLWRDVHAGCRLTLRLLDGLDPE